MNRFDGESVMDSLSLSHKPFARASSIIHIAPESHFEQDPSHVPNEWIKEGTTMLKMGT